MAESESTIAKAQALDVDTIMDPNFSVEKYLNASGNTQFNLLSSYVDKGEIESSFKINEFLKTLGAANEDEIRAQKSAAMSMFDASTESGLFASIKEGWNNNQIQMQIADIRLAEMNGQLDPDTAQQQVTQLKSRLRDTTSRGFNSWAKSAANMAPMMLETTAAGAKYAIPAGAAAGGVAFAAGQAGPQVALPEEVITVPGAALTFGSMGFLYGSANKSKDIETGLMYDELRDMVDDQGNRIDPQIMSNIAQTVGVVNGLLEIAQIGDIIKTIPGGKKLIAAAQRKTVKALVSNKSIANVLLKGGAKWAGHVGIETATEVGQETSNVVFGELAKNINNELYKTGFAPAAIEDITTRLVDTAKESAKAFTLISGPGNVVQTGMDAIAAAKSAPTPGAAGQTGVAPMVAPVDAVQRISRVLASEKVIPRLDVNSLGKTMVDIPTELPEKKPRVKRAPIEKELTPEEEHLLKQSESTLKAEEEFTITPNLYIGNVTARMKEAMGEAMGVDPEQIRGFTDGAWPTKRTKIELTMDEARALLVQMENSLQSRVDNDQLHNDSDLARANADWGDIRELRAKLGLPKTVRPFRVIREKGTRLITIENVRERIAKTTQTGALDMVETTKVQQIGDVMRRVAKYAKEGFAAGRKEMREQYQLLQYMKKQRELREKLIDRITTKPSDKIDFFYREAMSELQDAIDWGIKTEGKKVKKEQSRAALLNQPENYARSPKKLIDSFSKKNAVDLSYNDLLTLNDEIQRLRQLGLLKSEQVREQRKAAIESETKAFIDNIEQAKAPLVSAERAMTLKPMRIFDMLDGGKKFAGRIYNFFYAITNENFNIENQNIDNRLEAGVRRMNECGVSIKSLAKVRTIGDYKFTVDEILSVYAGWKNIAHRAKLQFGGIKTKYNKAYVQITDELYAKMMDTVTIQESTWADTVISEYQQNSYDRLRNTVIAAENRDMGREENYTPAPAADRDYVSSEQEILDELSYRHFISQIGPAKGFTIERKDIPPEYQNPVRAGLTELWFQSVRKQEHYINNALHIKDMQAILRRKEFRDSIKSKFGDSMLETVTQFVSRIANPDFYRSFDEIEKTSKVLRRHAAIAYISFNLSSVMNQVPAIMSYWANSSAMDIISSAASAALHPLRSYQKARDIHYQISHASIEREMEELENADRNAYQKIINKIGRAGMFGLFSMDRAVRVIGINAVYNNQIRKGMSESEARDLAAKTTLLTQEAASPKDLARIYATDEVLNWFLMFTNQLNQIYNITTYDIPAAWRNKNYREAGRSAFSLATMGIAIWMIQNKDIPDEPEDFLQAMADEFLSSIPIAGSWISAARQGWDAQIPPQAAVFKVVQGVNQIMEGDYEKGLQYLAEPIALGTGFPYQAAKEAYQFVQEELE